MEYKRVAVSQSVSLPPGLLREARQRAAADQRNLSSYIQKLVADDLARAARGAEPQVNFATERAARSKAADTPSTQNPTREQHHGQTV